MIVPIFCRLALPNQAHWFVDLCMDGSNWCFGRGWDLFAVNAGFQMGDELMFSYQSDGLFIVSILDNPQQLDMFIHADDPDMYVPDVQGLAPLPDMQLIFAEWDVAAAAIFAEWDAAAAAMAAAAHMPHPPANVVDLVEDGGHLIQGGEPLPGDDANAEGNRVLEDHAIAVDVIELGDEADDLINGGDYEGSGDAFRLVEEDIVRDEAAVEAEEGLTGLSLDTRVGESSGAGLDLELNLGGARPKRSTLFKNVGPSFTKKLEPTHISYGLSIPKTFWETYVRKPHGCYMFKLHMGGYAWDVEVRFKNARVRVRNGWEKFVRANAIDVGMILKVELFRVQKTHFLVTKR